MECSLGLVEHVSFNVFAFFSFFSEGLGAVQVSNTKVFSVVLVQGYVLNTFVFCNFRKLQR